MNEKVSFTKEELIGLLEEWIVYCLEDIKKYGFPEPFSNHPFQCVPDFVDGYFKEYFQPERSKREDSVSHTIPEWGSKSSLNFDEWQRRCGALNIVEIQ